MLEITRESKIIDPSSLQGINEQNHTDSIGDAEKAGTTKKSDRETVLNRSDSLQEQKEGKLFGDAAPQNITDLSRGIGTGVNIGAQADMPVVSADTSDNKQPPIVGDLQSIEEYAVKPALNFDIPQEVLQRSISKLVGEKMDLSKPKHNFMAYIFRAIYNFFAGSDATTLGQDDFIARTRQLIQQNPLILVFQDKSKLDDDELESLLKEAILAYQNDRKTSVTDNDAAERYAKAMVGVIRGKRTDEMNETLDTTKRLISIFQTFLNNCNVNRLDVYFDPEKNPLEYEEDQRLVLLYKDRVMNNDSAKKFVLEIIEHTETTVKEFLTIMADSKNPDLFKSMLSDYFTSLGSATDYLTKYAIFDLLSDIRFKAHLKTEFSKINDSEENINRLISVFEHKFNKGNTKVFVNSQLLGLTLTSVAAEKLRRNVV